MLPILSGLVYLGGGVLFMNAMSGLVYRVKTNEVDIVLLRQLDEANSRIFYLTAALLLLCSVLCFVLCYLLYRRHTRKAVIIIENLQIGARNMTEDITGLGGPRLQIPNGQHRNHMIEENFGNARGRFNHETFYQQQRKKAIRQSLEEQYRKLAKEQQQKETRKSSRHNFGGHRPRDIHPRRQPSKASSNEYEYETYFPTNDTDGSFRRRERCDSRRRHISTYRMNDFHAFQEERLLFYRSARGVDDIPREDYQSDNSSESDDERNERQMWDDEDIWDLRELEELQLVKAISLSTVEQ